MEARALRGGGGRSDTGRQQLHSRRSSAIEQSGRQANGQGGALGVDSHSAYCLPRCTFKKLHQVLTWRQTAA